MPIVAIVAIAVAAGICVLAVAAWGAVQVLDIMEALDLRRAERQRQLQKAREYLANPPGQTSSGATSYTRSAGYNVNTTTSTK